jgi:hypothetical protein
VQLERQPAHFALEEMNRLVFDGVFRSIGFNRSVCLNQGSQTSPRREQVTFVVVIIAEVGLELLADEIDFVLRWFAVMCHLGKDVGRAYHRVTEVVNDEEQSAVRGRRNDYTVVFLGNHAFFENEVCAAGGDDSVFNFRFVHATELVSVDTRAVDNNLSLDSELFTVRVHFVDAHAANNLALVILNE